MFVLSVENIYNESFISILSSKDFKAPFLCSSCLLLPDPSA